MGLGGGEEEKEEEKEEEEEEVVVVVVGRVRVWRGSIQSACTLLRTGVSGSLS